MCGGEEGHSAPLASALRQRQNRTSSRMIGSGMPMSHKSAPLPRPMMFSSAAFAACWFLCNDDSAARGRFLEPAQRVR
jgi:hypothetical protein